MFCFKRFSVNHSQSSMKVGTEAVLLGAWLPVPDNCKEILEIGCGCGVISLMLAQRCNAHITGIDIDEKSVKEAQNNAENSLWKNNVHFLHENVQHFAQKSKQKFDLIVSNPPFFENSLKSPKINKNISKHNVTLTFEELCASVDTLLLDDGAFGIILPADAKEKFEILAEKNHLYATKKTYIYPTSTKKENRVLMRFERKNRHCTEEKLVIRDKGYTDEYYQLVKDYLTINYEL